MGIRCIDPHKPIGKQTMITYRVEVENNGDTYWKNEEGEYHRLDGPAIERAKGNKLWYRNGKLHREDGPAFEGAHGCKEWYLEGSQYCEEKFNEAMNPALELTVAEIEKKLGYKIKVVKG